MDVMMGLLAAIMWGATDFFIGVNARSVGVKRAVFFGQIIGLALMLIIMSLSSSQWERLTSASLASIFIGVLASIFTLIGALSLSKAFSLGQTAIVAPVVTSYGMFTALLAWLSGDTISILQFAGIFLCFSGVALAGLSSPSGSVSFGVKNARAVGFAFIAALLYGSSFWMQGKFSLPDLGPINMLALTYIIGTLFLIPELFRVTRDFTAMPLKTFGGLFAASLLNLGGFSAFSWGAVSGSLSVVTVISTFSGAVAAMFGYFFNKEKLMPIQVVGVCLVLFGALMLHLFG